MDVPITWTLLAFLQCGGREFHRGRGFDIHAPLLQNIAASLGEKAFDMLGLLTR